MTQAPGTPTLDQLHVFIQVVETGSLTAAARKMNRALSVVSYTISNLEGQLGVVLFDKAANRRRHLTEAGRVVLADARLVTARVGDLRARVAGMSKGLEGELHVALDSYLSSTRVIDALSAFAENYPTVKLHIYVENLGAVASLVLERTAIIGISGPFTADLDDLHRISVGSLRMVPVAGARHPLASAGPHPPGAAREECQIVVSDRSPLTKGKDFKVRSNYTWRVADLSAKHMLLRAGRGWGMMPLAMVKDDLADGVLAQLDIPDITPFDPLMDAIYRTDTSPGPAATWLIERFRGQSSD